MGRLDEAPRAMPDQPQAIYDDQGRALVVRPGDSLAEVYRRGVPITGEEHENGPRDRERSNG